MIHIQRFIDRLQGFESRGQRDFNMSVKDAKDLHADITRLLVTLESLRQSAEIVKNDEVIQVNVTGGSF